MHDVKERGGSPLIHLTRIFDRLMENASITTGLVAVPLIDPLLTISNLLKELEMSHAY